MFFKTKKFMIAIGFMGIFCGASFATDVPPVDSKSSTFGNRVLSIKNFIEETPADNYDRSLVKNSYWNFFTKIDKTSQLRFLSPLMDAKSQRENWFERSNYIAEFFCFTSNLAILGVGIYDQSWSTIFAGLMSGISHAIPTNFAHNLDLIGVAGVGVTVLAHYLTVMNSPTVLYSGGLALALHTADAFISRKYGKIVGPWLHVSWHLAAAFALHNLNRSLA